MKSSSIIQTSLLCIVFMLSAYVTYEVRMVVSLLNTIDNTGHPIVSKSKTPLHTTTEKITSYIAPDKKRLQEYIF